MVFSVCYSDKILWREMETGDSIYLHRIVVNPKFKGQRLFGLILEWAIRHAKNRGIKFIRMDTWANDQNIIDYYKGFGFRFIEDFNTPDIPELPVHNRNIPLALLEYNLSDSIRYKGIRYRGNSTAAVRTTYASMRSPLMFV